MAVSSPDAVTKGAFVIDWFQENGSRSRGWRAYWDWPTGLVAVCADHTHRSVPAAYDCAVRKVNRDAKPRGEH